MKNITFVTKLFFAVTAFWYLTFFTGIYYSLSLFDGINGGRLHSILDGLLILVILSLFSLIIKNSILKRDYLMAALSILVVLWPAYWLFLTVYDTFFLFNTPYVRCMKELNDIALCEGK